MGSGKGGWRSRMEEIHVLTFLSVFNFLTYVCIKCLMWRSIEKNTTAM